MNYETVEQADNAIARLQAKADQMTRRHDGEVLDRVCELIERQDLTPEQKIHFIMLSLEYAKEDN